MSACPPPLRVLCLTMNPSVDLCAPTPRVIPTHKMRCGPALYDAGGGGINVARAISCLGGHCTQLCPVGGWSGQWLQAHMAQARMDSVCLPIAQPSRVGFTAHEQSTQAEYRFVMPGPTLSQSEWQSCLEHLRQLRDFPHLLVASGSLPPGVPDDFYARLALLCRQRGARLVLDTHGPALKAALGQGVYLLKPSLSELSELVGSPLETAPQWQAAARALVAQKQAEIVALTLGPQGALLVTRQGMHHAAALPIKASSTVGAGDSFLGGMVWALQQHRSLTEAFAWGMAAASAAVLSPGTGLREPQVAQQLFDEVHITALHHGL